MRPLPATDLILPGFRVLRGAHSGGTVLDRHTHDDPSLCYVFVGRFTEESAGGVFDCGADTVKLTVAGDPHSNHFIAEESQGLRVDIDAARFAHAPAIADLLARRIFVPRAGLRGPMMRVRREMDANDEVSPLVVEGLLLEVLARLAREATKGGGAPPSWLIRARDLVESLYTTGLSVGSIAAEVGVPDILLARLWRREFGASIGERVRELRVAQAAHELRTTDEPLTEIATRCGFYDQSHFTNAFRRARGVSPARFRSHERPQ